VDVSQKAVAVVDVEAEVEAEVKPVLVRCA
jgi:hypothetical protein